MNQRQRLNACTGVIERLTDLLVACAPSPRPDNFWPPWWCAHTSWSHRRTASRRKECRYLDGAADVGFLEVYVVAANSFNRTTNVEKGFEPGGNALQICPRIKGQSVQS